MSNQPGEVDPTPKDEIRKRTASLKALMAVQEIAFCLIMQNADLFYFTGSTQKGVLVVPLEGEPMFFVERSLDRAQKESAFPVIAMKSDKEIGRQLKDKGFFKGKGGMELDVVPANLFNRFKDITGCENMVDISGMIKSLRLLKSPFELEQLKKSGAICDRVHTLAGQIIREGMREIDLDAALVAEGRRSGHQGLMRMRGFNQEMMSLYVVAGYTGTVPSSGDVPISGLGLTPALAQGSSLHPIRKGVPVVVDYGGAYNGYITDETRSYVVGDLGEAFRKPYDCARRIVEETEIFGRSGVDATELFLRARGIAEAAHLGDYFMGYGPTRVSFIGHGLGLEINELPVLTARHHMILEEGMVFAFEPKFILPDKGAIGIEVDFIVRPDRLERLTQTPIDLVKV